MAGLLVTYRFWGIRKINRAKKVIEKYKLKYSTLYSGTDSSDKYHVQDLMIELDNEWEHYKQIVTELKECVG